MHRAPLLPRRGLARQGLQALRGLARQGLARQGLRERPRQPVVQLGWLQWLQQKLAWCGRGGRRSRRMTPSMHSRCRGGSERSFGLCISARTARLMSMVSIASMRGCARPCARGRRDTERLGSHTEGRGPHRRPRLARRRWLQPRGCHGASAARLRKETLPPAVRLRQRVQLAAPLQCLVRLRVSVRLRQAVRLAQRAGRLLGCPSGALRRCWVGSLVGWVLGAAWAVGWAVRTACWALGKPHHGPLAAGE
jgi:hypothetical protein